MKKFIYLSIVILIILLICVGFAPVEFDAKVCSGGFKSYVVQKQSDKLIELFNVEKGISGEIINETTSLVDWSGRNINVTVQVLDNDNKVYTVQYSGKRYWIERYNWRISGILET